MTGGFSVLPVDAAGARWSGVARVVGPTWLRLPSLTVGLLGVSTLWSLQMSYASPYLISLGLSKSLLSAVFLAGPLAGLIVQPVIGILADNSKSRFGRRRPLILISTVLSAFAIFLLGFTRSFASLFTTLGSRSNDLLTVSLAIFSIYCVDFCINTVQGLDRALLVDTVPISKQPAGNAWAARMTTIGNVIAFFIGNLDLPHLFPYFGNTQIKVFSVFTALFLLSTQAWTCFHVKERVLLASSSRPKGLYQELSKLWHTLVTLPRTIRQIYWVQFFAWLGWFPVLLYTTVYIGDLHKYSSPAPENQVAAMALDAEATRLGTRALFFSALASLLGNVVVPFFVSKQHMGHTSNPLQPKRKSWLERVRIHLASLWAFSHFLFAVCMAATFVTSTVSSATFIITVTGFCWAIAHWAPFTLLSEAILSHQASDDAGSIHLGDARSTRVVHPRDDVECVAGEEETEKLFQADTDDEEPNVLNGYSHQYAPSRSDISVGSSVSTLSSLDQEDQLDAPSGICGLGNLRARMSRIDLLIPSSPSVAHLEEGAMSLTPGSARKSANGLSSQAGTILGIHILFIVMPQFIVTGLSSIIFAIYNSDAHGHHPDITQPDNGTLGPASQDLTRQLTSRSGDFSQATPNSVAIIFRIGGIAAVVAGILAYRLAQDLKRR